MFYFNGSFFQSTRYLRDRNPLRLLLLLDLDPQMHLKVERTSEKLILVRMTFPATELGMFRFSATISANRF